MIRQLNFYMSNRFRQEFENYLMKEGFNYLDKGNCEEVTYIDSKDIAHYFYVYLYKQGFGNIYLNDTGIVKYIDGCYNPVIEYIRANVKVDQHRITRGRVAFSANEMYDENANRELVIKEYNRIIRWLKKHLVYKDIEVERFTYCKNGGYTIKGYIDEYALKMIIEDGFTLG